MSSRAHSTPFFEVIDPWLLYPLTEPDLKIPPDPDSEAYSLQVRVAIASAISSASGVWLNRTKRMNLSPVVAFPLATPVHPFNGESHDPMLKVL